ncbi:MAG: hypothetical protein L0H23_03195, partial [Luteimonas sp.]|nr:hypothetical protein [Luteimonas sp.]
AVWFGFSDVAWTQVVRRKHEREDYRKKHMRKIDVGTWVKSQGQAQPHLDSLSKLTAQVGEFALPLPVSGPGESQAEREARQVRNQTHEADYARRRERAAREGRDPDEEDGPEVELETVTVVAKPYPAFDFSLADFHNSVGTAEQLQADALQAGELGKAVGGSPGSYPPAMVAVDDPVGVTMELATLMAVRLQDFMSGPTLSHPLASSTLLQSLQAAIRNQGELARIRAEQAAEVREIEYWRNIPYYSGGEGIVDQNRIRVEENHRKRMSGDTAYRTEWNAKVANAKQRAVDRLTPKDLSEAADDAWGHYSDNLRDGEPQTWLDSTYKPALERFDQECIVPLAKAHKAWMQCELLLETLDCNYDDASPRSGEAFADTVLLCIQDTQQNKICFDLYADWLRADSINRGNLILRAIQYNQKAIIDQINATVPGLRKEGLPEIHWDQLIGMYDKAEAQMAQNGNAAARVVVAVAGPGFKALDDCLNRSVGAFLVSLGMMGKAPVTHVKHTGTVSQAIDKFVEMIQKTNPAFAGVDRTLMKHHFEIRSRGLRQTRQMRNADGRFGASEIQIRVDRFQLGQISAAQVKASPAAALDAASGALLRMDEWPSNGMARWKMLMNGSLKLGFVQAFLQLWDLHQLAAELDQAAPGERNEAQWKYRGAVMGAIGSVLELTETAITNSYKIGGGLSKVANTFLQRGIGVLARALGLGAAIVVAVFDGINAWNEWKEGDRGMAALYTLSAATGVASILLLVGWGGSWALLGIAATGWGLILLAVFIAVGLLIAYFKEDKLEEWMERSWFGDDKSFSSLDAELEAFKVATQPDKKKEAAESPRSNPEPAGLGGR